MSPVGPAAATTGRADGAPYLPAPIDDRPAFLTRPAPLIDTLPERWIAYLGNNVAQVEHGAPPITRSEIGMFVEMCATYLLDPFAKEAWLAKSKSGRLLVMVGRDGLRKIAQRNGLHIDSDVVRADDTYEVEYITAEADAKPGEWQANGRAAFHRVTHKRVGLGPRRGALEGSWCRVTNQATGRECGWFEGPLGEYKPASASQYSPWSKQVTIMLLGASERAAIREATPLSGLHAFGEHESAFASATALDAGQGDGQPQGFPLGDAIEAVLARAARLGVALDRGMVEMDVCDRDGTVIPDRAAKWIATHTTVLDAIPQDAEVVDAQEARVSAAAPRAPEVAVASERPAERGEPVDPVEALAVLRRRGENLLADADAADEAGHTEAADALRAEWEIVAAQVEAATDPAQDRMAI